MAPQGQNTATVPPDVAQQQLQNRRSSDHLRPYAMLGKAHGIADSGGFVATAVSRHRFGYFQKDFFGSTADLLDHLGSIAAVMLLHYLEDRLRVAEGHILLGRTNSLAALLLLAMAF